MADWVAEVAAKIKYRRDLAAKKEEQDRQKELLIVAGCEDTFRRFSSLVEGDIQRFNAGFPGEPVTRVDCFTRPTEDSFEVRKTTFPAIRITAELNRAEKTIEYNGAAYAREEDESTTPGMNGRFQVKMDGDGVFYLIHQRGRITPEQAARLLLEPFLLTL